MLSNISCTFGASSLVITFWAWILPRVCTDSLQHQIVWKLGNEWARSRCVWCISGHYESFRMIVTKTGRLCNSHLLPHYALRSKALQTTQRNAIKGILISDLTHFPISFSMLVSIPSHLGEKGERREKNNLPKVFISITFIWYNWLSR